jgi:hypothetical protein
MDDSRAANRARFELELEFVQSLANPFYLHSLAQQNILDQPAFINFLEYLLYWKEKDYYARFIQSSFVPIQYAVSTEHVCFQLPTCSASSRASPTRAVQVRNEKGRMARIPQSEAIPSLENLVSGIHRLSSESRFDSILWQERTHSLP